MPEVKSFVFNPVQENTYVLHHRGECIIIDPGCYFIEEREELVNFIEDNHLRPVMLVNTHCHLDHVFGNRFFSEMYNLPLHIHPLEERILEQAPVSGLMFNLPFDNYTGEIKHLQPGDELHLGEERLRILHTPGHSPGSLSFYNKSAGFVISGDALFAGSIGRTDLMEGDHDTLINSIRSQLFTLPEETVVYPGHGPATTIGKEIRTNPFLQ